MIGENHQFEHKRTILRGVTFDVWETLLLEKDGSNQQRTDLRCTRLSDTLSRFGVDIRPEQITPAIDHMISSLLKIWNRNKDVDTVAQLRLVIRYASQGRIKLRREWMDALKEAYVAPLFELPPYISRDAKKALPELRNQNKRIGLICNTGLTPGKALRKFLAEERVAQYFDVMTFSNEVRIRKPDPRIFYLTAQKLELQPHEIVHVGDNLRVDVWGAKAAGFKAVHLSTEAGRDKTAWADPSSLVSLSRNLGRINTKTPPDKTISSIRELLQAIKEIG